jgi:predicted transcriptional regulator
LRRLKNSLKLPQQSGLPVLAAQAPDRLTLWPPPVLADKRKWDRQSQKAFQQQDQYSMNDNGSGGSFIGLTATIVSAYVSNNSVPAQELSNLINQVHSALTRVSGTQGELPNEPLRPAVSVKKSVSPEYIVCLEDGKKFKSLKRHLRTQYGMTPEQYREKWGLPADYPMVAPNYAMARSQLAKQMGLGQQRRRRK